MSPAPLPGTPVRGSQTGRPIMAVLDLLGRRWTLRILWELRHEDRPSFRELRKRCGDVSSSVLSQRLRELKETRLLVDDGRPGYTLNDDGRHLLLALAPIESWAERWAAAAPSPEPKPKRRSVTRER